MPNPVDRLGPGASPDDATTLDRAVPRYGPDLRVLLSELFSPSVEPGEWLFGGALIERVRAWQDSAGCNAQLALGWAETGPTGTGVSSLNVLTPHQRRHIEGRIARAWHVVPVFLELLDLVPGPWLSAADDYLADLYHRRYAGWLMPADVLQLLARTLDEPGGEAAVARLDAWAQELRADPRDLRALITAWQRQRGKLLCLLPGRSHSAHRIAVLELASDILLLQAGAALDVRRAELERGERTRVEVMLDWDRKGRSLSLDVLLPHLLRPALVQHLSERERSRAIRALSARPTWDKSGLLSGKDPAPPRPVRAEGRPPGQRATAPAGEREETGRALSDDSADDPDHELEPAPGGPLEWESDAPPLLIPEWEALGMGRLSPKDASRHFLILGETGSGKTRSGLLPLVRAAARYGSGDTAPSMLCIDPKHELVDELEQLVGERLVRVGHAAPARVVHLFEGLAVGRMTADEIVLRIVRLSESWAEERHRTTQAFFVQAAERILARLVAIDLAVFRTGGITQLAAFWTAVSNQCAVGGLGVALVYSREAYLRPHLRFLNTLSTNASALVAAYAEGARKMGIDDSDLVEILGLGTLATDTLTSIIATAANAFRVVASDELARHVSVNPFEGPSRPTLAVRRMIESGGWIVYTPPDHTTEVATYVGKAIKTLAFDHVFRRENRERAVYYVCDEAQRFVTHDGTGEQSFLDRARAYRAVACLATQSLASLRYALAAHDHQAVSGASLDILLANTGTKLVFRTSDPDTRHRLRQLIPIAPAPGLPHVVDVRPPSTLRVGECYVLAADGSWNRGMVRLGGA
ncbi:MAG: hypothetical protein AMXMBFR53_09530 [Gemmatimonadota bacterium]